jgi:hypothetical protein
VSYSRHTITVLHDQYDTMLQLGVAFNLPTALAFDIFGEWVRVCDLARLDYALLAKPPFRQKLLELFSAAHFTSKGMSTEHIDELRYLHWLAARGVAVRMWTILNPRVTYFHTTHEQLFRSLKISAIEELTVNGQDEVSFLVKRIFKESKRLRSVKLSNLLWLTYPKLRFLLRECGSTLRVFHLDTVKYINSPYFLRLVPHLTQVNELMLGRIELNSAMLACLSHNCRKLHTVQFTSCPINNAALLEFMRSYTTSLPVRKAVGAASSAGQKLATLQSSQLRSISLTYNMSVNLSDIARTIADNCGTLTKLCLVGDYAEPSALSSEALIYAVGRLPWLQHLDVSKNNWLTDDAIHAVVTNCPQLRVLCIHACRRLTDAAVSAIVQHCTVLEDLDLSWNDSFTNTSLQLLGTANAGLLSHLRVFNISSCYHLTSQRDLDTFVSRCALLRMDEVGTKFTRLV